MNKHEVAQVPCPNSEKKAKTPGGELHALLPPYGFLPVSPDTSIPHRLLMPAAEPHHWAKTASLSTENDL